MGGQTVDVQEKLLRAIGTPPVLPSRPVTAPRRTLHRVETAALDLRVGVRIAGDIIQGYLLNISAGGCSIRVPLPMTLILDAGVSFDVILPLDGGELLCAGELVGLDVGKGTASLRLRFRSLQQNTRRSLLTLIGELVTRDFQLRNTGGNRTWVARQRE